MSCEFTYGQSVDRKSVYITDETHDQHEITISFLDDCIRLTDEQKLHIGAIIRSVVEASQAGLLK